MKIGKARTITTRLTTVSQTEAAYVDWANVISTDYAANPSAGMYAILLGAIRIVLGRLLRNCFRN